LGSVIKKRRKKDEETQTQETAGPRHGIREEANKILRMFSGLSPTAPADTSCRCGFLLSYLDFEGMPLKYFKNSESVDSKRDASLFRDSL